MLERIGVGSLDDLYSDVPDKFIYRGEYDLPDAMSEQQVRSFFESLDKKDLHLKVFAGAGAYDHYTPSVIPYICSRSEFLTAYTPYQAEISQGTLRYIFEYQSMICALTGMDVSNASMYDGPTAAAEAMMMAVACTKRKTRVLLSETLLPHVRKVVETYAKFHNVQLGYIPMKDGQTGLESMKEELAKGDVAGVIVPSLNRFGIVEDLTGFAEAVHEAKAIAVEYCDPSALAQRHQALANGTSISQSATVSLSVFRCASAVLTSALWPAAKIMCARCRDVLSDRHRTLTESVVSCLLCRPASSISAGRRLPATFALTRA